MNFGRLIYPSSILIKNLSCISSSLRPSCIHYTNPSPQGVLMSSPLEVFLAARTPEFIQIRRQLHRLAELSTLEYVTGDYLKSLLTLWDIPFEAPIADTGLTVTIPGKKPGPGKVVALRADMDALPIFESERCPWHSKTPGVMHACGHDAHMTIALGAARYFKEQEDSFSGCVRIFFQPAEETTGGAQRMVEEGCMEHPPVDYVTGLHVAPYLPTGDIEVKYGKLYAASDEVAIVLRGRNSHGAYPEAGVDAITLAAFVITSLQSLVSRRVSPLDQCVLTLGTLHGGAAHNILADRVDIAGALRTTDPATRTAAKEYITAQVTKISEAYGGSGIVTFTPGYDALVNTDPLVDTLRAIAIPLLGREHVHWKASPGMGVEDFSAFLEKAPGVFYHLGCGNEKKGLTAPLHSREFAVDEDCLALGIHLQIALAQELLITAAPA